MSIESMMASNHLIFCCHFILLSSIFPSIRVFSNSQLFSSDLQSIGISASQKKKDQKEERVAPSTFLMMFQQCLTDSIACGKNHTCGEMESAWGGYFVIEAVSVRKSLVKTVPLTLQKFIRMHKSTISLPDDLWYDQLPGSLGFTNLLVTCS